MGLGAKFERGLGEALGYSKWKKDPMDSIPQLTVEARQIAPNGGAGGIDAEMMRRFMMSQDNMEGMQIAREVSAIENLQTPVSVEIIRGAVAFEMGLVFPNETWNLEAEGDVALLMEMFATGEGMTDRPHAIYVEQAINAKLQREVKRLGRTDESSKIKGFYGCIESRRMIDRAFLQRTNADASEDMTADLFKMGNQQETPDKAAMNLLFRGDPVYGTLMDKALRAIVEVAYVPGDQYPNGNRENIDGIPVSAYSRGFDSTEIFRKWLGHVLSKCNNRMDIAWDAWKLALLWELPNEFGTVNDKHEIELPPPDIGNALLNYTAHWNAKSMAEFGLNTKGESTGQVERQITHSGLPLMFGHIKPFLRSYLHSTKVTNEAGEEKTLFDVWYKDEVGFQEEKFPWMATETQGNESMASGEPPSGSFAGWRLSMGRANTIRKDLLSIVPTSDLGKPSFFTDRVRVWAKIFGKIKPEISPENNPRVWWVMAQITYRVVGTHYSPEVFKDKKYADFRTPSLKEDLHQTAPTISQQKISYGDILASAGKAGFLRSKDIEYCKKMLALDQANRDY